MKTIRTYLGILVAAPLLALIPVVAAIQLANNQSIDYQSKELEHLAFDLARRANETGEQLRVARDQLNSGKYGAPASPREIERMRFLSLTSTYLQAVGRMKGTKVICSSMGMLPAPVDLGPPNVTTVNNVHIWLNAKPSFAGGAVFHAVESDGCVVLFAPDLMFDVFSDESHLAMAIVTGTKKRVLTEHGQVKESWFGRIEGKSKISFLEGSDLIAMQRCSSFDLFAVVAQPIDQAHRRFAYLALIFVPLGAMIGVVIAFVSVRSFHQINSMPFQLRSAIRKREFYLVFQPIINLTSGETIGCEALIRWRSGTGQIISPDQFIPVAEKLNLIGSITEQVIEMSFIAAKQLFTSSPNIYMGLNVSSSDVRSGQLPRLLLEAANTHGVPLARIGIEVTETGLLSSLSDLSAFEAIRAVGVKTAMDDFGTGYSSLAYLMRLQVDALKIDKIFVDAIGTESATSNVIYHMVRMANELQKSIIAEGVESEGQAEYLRVLGVQFAQGYYFGKPMSVEDLMKKVLSSTALPEA